MGLVAISAFASQVRTLGVNNETMAPVFLKMGKSTVLRFVDKPKKVVIGNKNYYGLEFIENDVAIQPLGSVATNLFVYTEHHTYGFLLTPGEKYDDLVFVRWKYQEMGQAESNPPPAQTGKVVNLKSTFKVGDGLKISIVKIQGPSTFGLHIVDCGIENVGKDEVDISGLELHATRAGRELDNQRVVIEHDKLKPHERTRARIVMKLGAKADFFVEAGLKSANGKTVIPKKIL